MKAPRSGPISRSEFLAIVFAGGVSFLHAQELSDDTRIHTERVLTQDDPEVVGPQSYLCVDFQLHPLDKEGIPLHEMHFEVSTDRDICPGDLLEAVKSFFAVGSMSEYKPVHTTIDYSDVLNLQGAFSLPDKVKIANYERLSIRQRGETSWTFELTVRPDQQADDGCNLKPLFTLFSGGDIEIVWNELAGDHEGAIQEWTGTARIISD